MAAPYIQPMDEKPKGTFGGVTKTSWKPGEAPPVDNKGKMKRPTRDKMPDYIRFRAMGKTPNQSARAAGMSEYYCKNAFKLEKYPEVIEELAKIRKRVAEQAFYDAAVAMKELQDTIQFARDTENAAAMAKAVELKMKLAGLLIERHDMRNVGSFSVNIIGIEGNAPDDPVLEHEPLEALPEPDEQPLPDELTVREGEPLPIENKPVVDTSPQVFDDSEWK